MKRLMKLIILSVIVLGLTAPAVAGDSVSIKVSCVIPAIPGVNAPPYPSEEVRQAQEGRRQISTDGQMQSRRMRRERKQESTEVAYITEEEAAPVEQRNIEETQLANNQITRTVYSR